MTDSLRIITNDFSYNHVENINSKYPLVNEFNSVVNGETGEQPRILIDEVGKEFRGKRLSLVGNPINNTGVLNIGVVDKAIGTPYLSFMCSVPKYLTGDNFLLATKGDLQRFFLQVEKDFRGIGIKFNPLNCHVSRLDLTKNIVTRYPFYKYIEVLKYVGCSRKSDKKTMVNAECFCIGNKSKEVCCYDKIQEMLNNKQALMNGLSEEDRIFRCESRFLSTATVKTVSKKNIITCSDLLLHYDETHELYKTNLRQKLLKNAEMKDCRFTVDTEEILKQSLQKEKTEKKIVKDFIDTCLIQSSKEVLDSINVNYCVEQYEQSLLNSGFDEIAKSGYMRKRLSTFKKELNTYIWYWLAKVTDTDKISVSELYNELYEKLLEE